MNSKEKGNRGERELLSILLKNGLDAKRNQQGRVAGKMRGGFENPDISAIINGRDYHVEVKRCERLNVRAAIDQATRDANGKALPMVCHRSNNQDWLVTMRFSDWLSSINGGD